MRRFDLACVTVVVAAACVAWGGEAGAQSQAQADQARARYDEGAAAYDDHRFADAARDLAEADRLAPNPVALKLALAAVTRTDDAVLAMRLVRRVEERGGGDATTADLASRVRAQFARAVGFVRVVCAKGEAACKAVVAGDDVAGGDTAVVRAGGVDATFEGSPLRFHLDVPARATVDLVEPSAPAAPPPAATPAIVQQAMAPSPPPAADVHAKPLSPLVFWIAAGVTVVVGAVTVASALDTKSQHDTYLRDPTADGRDRGQSAQLRTNVLAGATGAAAIATAAVGVFFTRWTF